jgi:tetratricopeptide (TPR) repeat protein
MLSCNNSPGNKGLARAYRLFSLVNLSNKRISEALDYFSFAVEQAEKSEDFGELGISAYYAAGTHFLYGNIAKAERLALQAEQAAFKVGRAAWADKAKFLRGKLRFESGRYRDACECFEDLRNNPSGTLPADAEQVLDAWIYRSRVYKDDRTAAAAATGVPCRDALFFETEAAYLRGDYQRALELAEELLSELAAGDSPGPERTEPAELFLFIEQPDWRSGFTQCELYLLPPKDFWGPLLAAYRNLARCRIDQALPLRKEGSGDLRQEARQSMQRIVQDERLSEMDPNGSFFFFAWYRILQESGAMEVDMNTAVSMAFKRLQLRASRIDDSDTRRSFLTLHYWNSALGEVAKQHKLI